jgi:transketolase
MGEKVATRNAYGQALAELATQYPEVVCFDADLSGATMTKFFQAAHPDRFFDMGIAECNMQGVAAGLATCGYKSFTNTFAMFAAGRSWEQVRNSICYPGLNVKVVGSHGGLSVGEDGATHQCIEDFALMRAIPGMMVLCPCDAYEMRQAVDALIQYNGPAYMRLGRLDVETITNTIDGYRFELGKGAQLRDGSDVTLIANGMMVQMALQAAEILSSEGISARVIDMHTIKPLDVEIVRKAAEETGAIVVSEEHNIIGGLGEAVAAYCAENCIIPVVRHGVNNEFGRSGKAPLVLEAYGLTAEVMVNKAKLAVGLKHHR